MKLKSKTVRMFAGMMDLAAAEMDAADWDAPLSAKLEDLGIAVEELDDAIFRDQRPAVIVEKSVDVAIAAMMIATKSGG